MAHQSTPEFRTFHALRIKGFATSETIAEISGLDGSVVQEHLEARSADGHVAFREARSLWQLTPDGRTAHADELQADLDGVDAEATIGANYPGFLELNSEFKELCGAWQLRDGEPNDHSDAAYDAEVLGRLGDLHSRAYPIVDEIGSHLERMSPYAGRLAAVHERVQSGETNLFTGVMCNSYHDVWMELHEDLILSQGIDRAAEGSF